MNIVKPTITAFIICFLFTTVATAQEGHGGQAGAFLRMGVGARAMGMGNAFSALADDGSALYWNPAGLGFITNNQLLGMYSKLSMDRAFNFAGLVLGDQKQSSFSVGWINYGVSRIDGRDPYGEKTAEFSNNETALQISYGKGFGSFLAIGATAKFLSHNLSNYKASGHSYDFGLIVSPIRQLRIGACVQDFSGQLKWNTASKHIDTIPLLMRGGLAVLLRNNSIKLAGDVYKIGNHEKLHFNFGGECWIINAIAMRTGVNDGKLTAGASVHYDFLQIDYAYIADSVLEMGALHRIGVLLIF